MTEHEELELTRKFIYEQGLKFALRDYLKKESREDCQKCERFMYCSKKGKYVNFDKVCDDYTEEKQKVLYLCDRRACDRCSSINCEYTEDITHAKNFQRFGKHMIENYNS